MKNKPLSVRDYMRLIFRRRWALLVPFAGSLLLVPILWVTVPPKYEAAALVKRTDPVILQSAPGSLVAERRTSVSLDALRLEILTWNNLDRVIKQTNLDVGLVSARQWQDMYDKVRRAITIRGQSGGPGVDWIEVAVVHEEPNTAANMANAIADNYVEETKRTSRQYTQEAVGFYEEGAKSSLAKLQEAERRIEEYKAAHFTNLPAVRDRILSSLLSFRTEEMTQQMELMKLQANLEVMKRALSGIPETVIKAPEVTNPMVAQLETEILSRRRVLASWELRYAEGHPQLARLRREIEDLQAQLAETPKVLTGEEEPMLNPQYEALLLEKRVTERNLERLTATLSELKSRIQANQQELGKLAEEERHYNDLLRDQHEAAESYDLNNRSLRAAEGRLRVEMGQYGTVAEVDSRALVPTRPYPLERLKLALAALVGGLAVGVALMFGLEITDRSLRNVEDAADFLDLPVLGSIPKITSPLARRRKRIRRFAIIAAVPVALAVAAIVVELLIPGTISRDLVRLAGEGKTAALNLFGQLRAAP